MDLPFRYLDKKDICPALKACPSKLQEMINAGLFPRPEKHGFRSLWRSDVVARWLEEQSQKAQAESETRAKAALAKAHIMVSARRDRAAA